MVDGRPAGGWNMVTQCSYSGVSADENVARVTALFTVAVVAAAVVTGWVWIYAMLGVDFALRSRIRGRRSLLGFLARRLVRAFGFAPAPTDAGPKAFAAKIGLLFSVGALILGALGYPVAAAGVALTLGACAGLEAFAGFCVGCLMYSILVRAGTRLGLVAKHREQYQGQ
jgi:hypothetical protein